MILIDIGNSNAKIFDNFDVLNIDIAKFIGYIDNNANSFFNIFPKYKNKKIYFINVNPNLNNIRLCKDFIDISRLFKFKTKYVGIGIDRIAGCYCIDDGVVVDVGSAITIDIMQNGEHLGGWILPGIATQVNLFKSISSKLDVFQSGFKIFENVDMIPQNTSQALSLGIISPIVNFIKRISGDKNIIFTGGDGELLSKFFKNCLYDKNLVFSGMMKALNENMEQI